jgi:hypothetical protein
MIDFESRVIELNNDAIQILYILFLKAKLPVNENKRLAQTLNKFAIIPFYENFVIKNSKEIKLKTKGLNDEINKLLSKFEEVRFRRKNLTFKHFYFKKCKKIEAQFSDLFKSQRHLLR